MSEPRRIQRRRTKGWRMPEGAVYVGRPSRWGNPFPVGPNSFRVLPDGTKTDFTFGFGAQARLFRVYAVERLRREPDWLNPLRGRDLACWCPPSYGIFRAACHADVLLELANS